MANKEEEGTLVYREEKKKREQEMKEEQKEFKHPKYGAEPGKFESAEESYGASVEGKPLEKSSEEMKKKKETTQTGTAEAR